MLQVNKPFHFERLQSDVFYADNCVEIQQPVNFTACFGAQGHALCDDERPPAACFDNPVYSVHDDTLLFTD